MGGDCANFVSQCLIAGGIDFKKIGRDVAYGVGGTVPNEVNLGNRLKKMDGLFQIKFPEILQKEMLLYIQDMQL